MNEQASKKPKLIVLAAFNESDDGDLVPAFDAKQFDSEDRATREARSIAQKHAGVIAWAREADPVLGEYGPPIMLFQAGRIPDME
jgi:hypothetical protein